MKIDIHVHTKKTKQGDAQTREIDAQRFHEIISSTDVKIVAITNHNHFDLTQYNNFTKIVGDDFQIWPGVELDIVEDGRRGHLLVVVSPGHAQEMETTLRSMMHNKFTPNDFEISIDDVVLNFDCFKPLYIAHYKKKPDLIDKDIEKLISQTAHKNRVLKEASNSISAGIFLSHGHSSIYGSDIQDWEEYQAQSKMLPDLRLPVESFEQFCLLLNKDQTAINSLLDKKSPEKISIQPFEDGKTLELLVYNDINIFFGAKGTGKSRILEAIARYYSEKGITAYKFESSSSQLSDEYDCDCKKMSIDLLDHGISYCKKEIDSIKKARETDVTSMSKYRQFFSKKIKNANANKIKIKNFIAEDIQVYQREFVAVNDVYEEFKKFNNYIKNEVSVTKFVDNYKLKELSKNLNSIIKDLEGKRLKAFVEQKVTHLFNSLIETVKLEVTKKAGIPSKPSGTGFRNYASNRISIELNVRELLKNIRKKIDTSYEYIGNLDEKGDLHCKTEIKIDDGTVHDGKYKSYSSVKRTPQKKFSKAIISISDNLYSSALFEKISDLNSIDGVEYIPTIEELLLVCKYFTIDDELYEPSTGESSMLLLHKELIENKDVYILDEPEKSLGNEYINNIIVPLIKDKSKVDKKIFIATHDANIAVRTLPYNSVYRMHSINGYKTFVGNPFSNNLVNINDEKDKIDWKEISMRTLEGGKNAFGERGQIYGNP